MHEIANRIKRRREQLGMTQEDLASKMGYKQKSTIAKWELGIRDVPARKVAALAEALETQAEYLVGWADTPAGMPANSMPVTATYNVRYNDYTQYPVPVSIKADFCIEMQDDSLSGDDIRKGDVLYIRKVKSVKPADLAAVVIEGTESTHECIIKHVYAYPEHETVILRSSNPKYQDVLFFGNETSKVMLQGRVVYVGSRR
jgi:repressor LexA